MAPHSNITQRKASSPSASLNPAAARALALDGQLATRPTLSSILRSRLTDPTELYQLDSDLLPLASAILRELSILERHRRRTLTSIARRLSALEEGSASGQDLGGVYAVLGAPDAKRNWAILDAQWRCLVLEEKLRQAAAAGRTNTYGVILEQVFSADSDVHRLHSTSRDLDRIQHIKQACQQGLEDMIAAKPCDPVSLGSLERATAHWFEIIQTRCHFVDNLLGTGSTRGVSVQAASKIDVKSPMPSVATTGLDGPDYSDVMDVDSSFQESGERATESNEMQSSSDVRVEPLKSTSAVQATPMSAPQDASELPTSMRTNVDGLANIASSPLQLDEMQRPPVTATSDFHEDAAPTDRAAISTDSKAENNKSRMLETPMAQPSDAAPSSPTAPDEPMDFPATQPAHETLPRTVFNKLAAAAQENNRILAAANEEKKKAAKARRRKALPPPAPLPSAPPPPPAQAAPVAPSVEDNEPTSPKPAVPNEVPSSPLSQGGVNERTMQTRLSDVNFLASEELDGDDAMHDFLLNSDED